MNKSFSTLIKKSEEGGVKVVVEYQGNEIYSKFYDGKDYDASKLPDEWFKEHTLMAMDDDVEVKVIRTG